MSKYEFSLTRIFPYFCIFHAVLFQSCCSCVHKIEAQIMLKHNATNFKYIIQTILTLFEQYSQHIQTIPSIYNDYISEKNASGGGSILVRLQVNDLHFHLILLHRCFPQHFISTYQWNGLYMLEIVTSKGLKKVQTTGIFLSWLRISHYSGLNWVYFFIFSVFTRILVLPLSSFTTRKAEFSTWINTSSKF